MSLSELRPEAVGLAFALPMWQVGSMLLEPTEVTYSVRFPVAVALLLCAIICATGFRRATWAMRSERRYMAGLVLLGQAAIGFSLTRAILIQPIESVAFNTIWALTLWVLICVGLIATLRFVSEDREYTL